MIANTEEFSRVRLRPSHAQGSPEAIKGAIATLAGATT
jgi:hypothetical protein